jgi:16S rRNA (uracil1498-N3)-methyltransferase
VWIVPLPREFSILARASERIYRLYVPDLSQAGEADELSLPTGEVHHALHVLRLRQGDTVELFDGRGLRGSGNIASVARNSMTVRTAGRPELTPRRAPAIHLGFAVPKGNRLDYLLEKATELGAASIEPVMFQRSVAGAEELSAEKQARWLGQCIAAAKQSALDYLPTIAQIMPLEQWANIAASLADGKTPASPQAESRQVVCLMGDASRQAVAINQALSLDRPADIYLLVGPEGGITDEERELARRAGFQAVRIGWTTLRVETAVLALMSAVSAFYT